MEHGVKSKELRAWSIEHRAKILKAGRAGGRCKNTITCPKQWNDRNCHSFLYQHPEMVVKKNRMAMEDTNAAICYTAGSLLLFISMPEAASMKRIADNTYTITPEIQKMPSTGIAGSNHDLPVQPNPDCILQYCQLIVHHICIAPWKTFNTDTVVLTI